MIRLALVAAVSLWSAGAVAGPRENQREANKVLSQFSQGQMSVQQTANRIDYLGAHAQATIYLCDMLRRPIDPTLEGPAVDLLATVAVKNPEAEQVLMAALEREEVGMRRDGARGLGRVGTGNAVRALVAALQDKASGVRRQAALSLGRIGNPKAGKALLAAAKLEDDPEVRSIMLVAVGQSGDAKQAKPLTTFLDSSSESARLGAGRALCLLGAKEGLDFAKDRLTSKEASERLQGVLLFEGAPSKKVAKALNPLLKDADHKVRATAARILAEGGDRTRVEWLVIESFSNTGEQRLPYEEALERLRLTDEERSRILKRAGLK